MDQTLIFIAGQLFIIMNTYFIIKFISNENTPEATCTKNNQEKLGVCHQLSQIMIEAR